MPAVLTINHIDLENLPQSFVSLAAVPGDQVLYVKNSAGFGYQDYIVTGVYGDPQSEIVSVSANPSSNTQIPVTTVSFPRPADTQVNKIPFNSIKIYRSATGTGGTYLLLTQIPIAVNQPFSTFIDYEAVSPYSYRYTFYNSNLNIETEFSSEMPYDGFPFWSLNSIQRRVLKIYVDNLGEFISPDSITDWCNELTARLNREVTDSESALFANFFTFTPGGAEYTDISAYGVEAIHRIDYSTDGVNFLSTINPMDFRVPSQNPTSFYTWVMEGNNLFIGQQFPSNYVVRVWYFGQQPMLQQDSDTIPAVYRSFSDVYVDYCLMRASEQSRRLSESATYYDRKFIDGMRSCVESVRSRINQGNKSMATTWLNDFPDNYLF